MRPVVSGDEVLVLVDNTVFGGAGDGMIITPNCFIGRDMGEAPVRVEIASVREVRLEEGILSRKIWINGSVVLVTLNCPGQPGVQALVGMMCEIVAGGAGAEPDLDPLAAPASTHGADCQSCGAHRRRPPSRAPQALSLSGITRRPRPPARQNSSCSCVTKLALLSLAAMPRPPEILRMPSTVPPPKGTTTFAVILTRSP
jgi:hypothetical protein